MEKTKLVPSLRFKGFTETWEQRELSELATFSKGSGYAKGDLVDNGSPIILYGRLYTKYETTISDVDTYVYQKSGSIISAGGEVIVPASGETAEDIAIASVVEKPGIILGGDLNVIHPKETIESTFLAFSITYGFPHIDMAKRAQGKSVVHLHNSDLKKVLLSSPKRDEQLKISQYLMKLDSIITLHHRKYDKLTNMKAALLEKMFPQTGENTPRVRFKGFADAWEQRELQSVVEKFSTGLNPRDNFTLNSGGKNYYVTIKNFTHGNLVLDDQCDKIDDEAMRLIQNRSNLEKGDILFSSIGRVGDCVLLDDKPKNWNINESVFALKPTKNKVYPLYLMHTIHSDKVLSDILNKITGSTFKSIKMAQLRKTVIPFPSKEEQAKIGKFIQLIDNLITLHQRKLEKLKNLKNACLKKMFV